MFTEEQEQTLKQFADFSDKLFELGVISTDSFTGEIGEYVACLHFNLDKSARVTRAIDGVSKTGERYQVKAKVITRNNFSCSFKDLEHTSFEFIAIVYFDKDYNPLKIIRIPTAQINNGELYLTSSNLTNHEVIEKSEIKIPTNITKAINDFARSYNDLEICGVIRSRRIVGDIGEFYACRKLNLQIISNKNEKGIDARHSNGLTFEIKTRRVYQSGRRIGEARRLNNLDGKTADYLIVVALDRTFICAGMWIIPMYNISNPKSAHLTIVNNTQGTQNLIPSNISWLNTGESFTDFSFKKEVVTKRKNKINHELTSLAKGKYQQQEIQNKTFNPPLTDKNSGCAVFFWAVIGLFTLLYLIGLAT
jgi:hypothetical protein